MGDLTHSAKGTHWTKKDHKYVKKIGDVYYYDVSGKGYKDAVVKADREAKSAYDDVQYYKDVQQRYANNPDIDPNVSRRLRKKYNQKEKLAYEKHKKAVNDSFVANNNYWKKSLSGISKSAISSGKDFIHNLLKRR